MPSPIRGVHNVVAPPIRLSVSNCVLELAKLNANVVVDVVGAVVPAHEWGFVAAPVIKLHRPALPYCLIGGVAVHVLPLRHVDAHDSIAHHLSVPGSHPVLARCGALRVMFGSFVNTDLLWVHVSQMQSIPGNTHTLALNCTMYEFLSVG